MAMKLVLILSVLKSLLVPGDAVPWGISFVTDWGPGNIQITWVGANLGGEDYWCEVAVENLDTRVIEVFIIDFYYWDAAHSNLILTGDHLLKAGHYRVLTKSINPSTYSLCYALGNPGWYSLVQVPVEIDVTNVFMPYVKR